VMLNAQIDGLVVLGIGAAVALWTRPWLAGFALGLTLMKPQLMLPLALALLLMRAWKVLGGWAAAGVLLLAVTSALNPHWVLDWLALCIWGEARWYEWLGLSVGALVAALAPAPIPALVGVLTAGWVCLRASGFLTWPSPGPVPASAR